MTKWQISFLFLCITGIFFTPYFVDIPMYYFYKDSVGFDEGAETTSDEWSRPEEV